MKKKILKRKKKSETELTVNILKEDQNTQKRLNGTLFNQTKQDKMQIFKESPLFSKPQTFLYKNNERNEGT